MASNSFKKIQCQFAYCDYFSEDKSNGKIKKKYKLLLSSIPESDLYFFNVLTTDKYNSCHKKLTVVIDESSWINRSPKHLKGSGKADIRDIDVHSKQELIDKLNDSNNRLPIGGKLCDDKFFEILEVSKKYKFYKSSDPTPKIKIIDDAYKSAKTPESILASLQLI